MWTIYSVHDHALQVTSRGGQGIAVYCDHSDPEDVKKLFQTIAQEQNNRLDICSRQRKLQFTLRSYFSLE
jgi:NAD(P)-dependent dehydrogenase (short-subunit alcohol dehydrogenase family)